MFLPSEASTFAQRTDTVFLYILALSVAMLIFITALMVTFVIRYSRKRHPHGEDIEGHTALEITWTVVPLVLFLAMFYFGWTNFAEMRNPPRDAMVVKVTARQWAWRFEYPNGKQSDVLYLALGRPVRTEVRSLDVIHGFYIPAFRIKIDGVPGKANYAWFTPTELGSFDIECTVICGPGHSSMLSHAVVVTEDQFKAWLFGGEDAPPPGPKPETPQVSVTAGPAGVPEVLKQKGCLVCHSTDGAVMVGPTFKGLFGSRQTIVVGGQEREITVDETFLREAIQDPMAQAIKGYPPAMPPSPLAEDDLKKVIEYIKKLPK